MKFSNTCAASIFAVFAIVKLAALLAGEHWCKNEQWCTGEPQMAATNLFEHEATVSTRTCWLNEFGLHLSR